MLRPYTKMLKFFTNALSSSLWQVRYGYDGLGWTSNTTNFSISTNCWNQEQLQLKLISNNSASQVESIYFHCYDGTSWELIAYQNQSEGVPAIWEEAMWWNTTIIPKFTTLKIKDSFLKIKDGHFILKK